MTTMRREMLAGIGLTLGVATAGRVGVAMRDHDDQVSADLDHYRGLGSKASGGTGDIAVGDWLATELAALGFTIERQPISVPFFTVDRAEVEANGARAEVVPQAIVVPTAPNGVTGTLVRVDPATASANAGRLDGAIALVDLPFARWSSARPIRGFVDGLFAAGAKAALLVTNGPAGGAIALNADGAGPMFAGPVAVLAPSDAARFHVAAAHGGTATLRITGEGGRRPAFNIAARLDRGSGAWLAVSTPRSGWFTCAGERGPGVAVWLGLARWAVAALPAHDLAFICTSGHEYENLGAEQALAQAAPALRDTALWLHLGSNVAARDWHDLTPRPTPLTTADPQRYLVVSPALIALARRAFAGQPGLADPYPCDIAAEGELRNVIAAGYPVVAGVYGAHRFHHARDDTEQCLLPEATVAALKGFRTFVAGALGR
ncbi:hypothetical protein F9288_13355 [Sphingomonas sp. CL5.1]|uniref:hypothetical protein n=1 Tax=Sphingomonas sp. CL5.1 TaxID=2653203 RepID=UPI0015814D14|nr:hypothetical protein [Sphingomonas sp. CL5.1]QKS00495.1 hypothetical protein F9288_13355 [Sphingomonas sp. CL5.1]